MAKKTKAQLKAERQAALRRELGLESEGESESTRVHVQGEPVAVGTPSGRRTEPVRSSGSSTGPERTPEVSSAKRVDRSAPVASGKPRGQASFERPDSPPFKPSPVTEYREAQTKAQEQANAAAREAKLVQVATPTGIDPKHHPKKHAPGSLKRGDTVWYRGDRFWIETCPKTWEKSCFVRICNRPVIPDPRLPTPSEMALTEIGLKEKNMKHAKGLLSFHVHPDLVSLAPPPISTFARPPTQAEAERKERTSKGQKDVGDPVAVMLREAKSLDDVYKIGAEFLEMQVEDLKKRYAHLNAGQQRMNVGNKMRAKWRKEQK